jgi:hypothetical protein
VKSLVNKEGSIEIEKLKKMIPEEWNDQDIGRLRDDDLPSTSSRNYQTPQYGV